MASNKKDVLKSNLRSRKASDKKIEEVTKEINKEALESSKKPKKEDGEKGFHIKFPMSHYNKLDEVSKKTHIPKKYIIMQALQEYYNKHDH